MEKLSKAYTNQVKYYNSKYIPWTFKADDKVYLNSKNIDLTKPSKKLDYKYYNLFEVEMPIKKQVYWLKLTPKIKMHNVFYVSLLEPCKKTNDGNLSALFSIIIEKKTSTR